MNFSGTLSLSPGLSMLRWPRKIPLAVRETLGTEACFKVGRAHATESARLVKGPVRLSGNALILVICGSVMLERAGQRLLLDEGSGCLILPGDMYVTEVPDRVGRFRYEIIFFGDRATLPLVRNYPEIEALAAIMRPGFVELYPINTASTRWLCSLVAAGRSIPNGLAGILRLLLHDVSVPAYLFLRHGYFARRHALDLWLEEHVISQDSIQQIATRFPGGARRFFTAFKTYQEISPTRWLRRRRMELAAVWLGHGDQIEAMVRRALGYLSDSAFRRDYKLEKGQPPARVMPLYDGPTMKVAAFLETIRPFWLVDHTTWQRLEDAKTAKAEALRAASDGDVRRKTSGTPEPKENLIAAARSSGGPARSSDEWIRSLAKAFWALQTTASDAVFLRQLEDEFHPTDVGTLKTSVECLVADS